VAFFVLALVGHTVGALGCPMPARSPRGAGQPYPCQNRPCGCGSAEECWKGDCCCFTLEQKLAWAVEIGVEPPGHVRTLVDARKATRPLPCQQGCCRPPDQAGCPECAPEASGGCCQKKPAAEGVEVRWVAGVLAQKCRGEGPSGLFQFDPSLVSDLAPMTILAPEWARLVCPRPGRANSQSHRPPTPPPRRS
jgi:hypothetical protein